AAATGSGRGAGIGDDEVERMLMIDRFDERAEPGAVRHVAGADRDLGAALAAGLRDRAQARLVAAEQGRGDAGAGIGEGKRLANSARSAGDEDRARLLQGWLVNRCYGWAK